MSNTITRDHRLSVARAWEPEPFSPYMMMWIDGKRHPSHFSAERLDRLAQVVADAEGAFWVPVEVGLPDSDVQVVAMNASGDRALVTLEFTDDSEGHGEPYWSAGDWDAALSDYAHWRPLPAKPPEQP